MVMYSVDYCAPLHLKPLNTFFLVVFQHTVRYVLKKSRSGLYRKSSTVLVT